MDDWEFDPDLGVYFHFPSATYATLNGTKWEYIPASAFTGRSSTMIKEEGEIDEFASTSPNETDQSTPLQILRLVVSESLILPPGSVVIIDSREGGIQIGRDRSAGEERLRLKEMPVSKTHATIYYGQGGEWEDAWFVVDTGSSHGTFVDDVRLSVSKTASKPARLLPNARLTIGSTVFIVHIHEDWPCDACQLAKDNEIRLDTGKERPVATAPIARQRGSMAELKARLLAGHEALKPSSSYTDRSAIRRARRSASPESQSSFGDRMLSAQGWKPGQGLGKNGKGRVVPIQVETRGHRLGLGESEDWKVRGKHRRYKDY